MGEQEGAHRPSCSKSERGPQGGASWGSGYAPPTAGLVAFGDTHLPQEAVGLLVKESDLVGACVGALVV